jgi:hypothetical protein
MRTGRDTLRRTMNILLLGTGMQGKAALHDLAASPAVARVVAANTATRWSAPESTRATPPRSIG